MKPWELLDEEPVPGEGGSLQLFRRGEEYSIRANRLELMNSRVHGSEEALARLACRSLASGSPRVLVGGLGMGFTLAELLRQLPAAAEVVVAELVAAVVRWNRELLGHLAGNPLEDRRARVEIDDVSELIASASASYHAILLDVDNGPNGLTHPGNERLYGRAGLESAYRALRAGGVLAVWSAAPDTAFRKRLDQARFSVDEQRVRAHGGRGPRHWIWLATRATE